MTIDQIKQKIDKYLDAEDRMPRIVDLPNVFMLNQLKDHFKVGKNEFLDASEFAKNDNLPLFEEMLNKLCVKEEVIFLHGIAIFLQLLGREELNRIITRILGLVPKKKLVVLTHGCHPYIKFNDPRIEQRGQYLVVEGEEMEPLKIRFVTKELANHYETLSEGINHLSKIVESDLGSDIRISTKHKAKGFPHSLIDIRDCDSVYQAVVESENIFSTLREGIGTTEQWSVLLELLHDNTWEEIVNTKFGGKPNLPQWFAKFPEAETNDKWLFFLALKTFGVPSNEYLNVVVTKTTNVEYLPQMLYNTLLDYSVQDKDQFDDLYTQRRDIVRYFNNCNTEIANYCKRVLIMHENMLDYLTDCNQQEKELIFQYLETYGVSEDRDKWMPKLKVVYSDLYAYLQGYNSGIDLLDEYIPEYKFCKVTNRISDDHRNRMEKQAKERDYNLKLSPRSLYVHQLNSKKATAYFVDALGVEYLSYIQNKCAKNGLSISIKIGRCELPSLTSLNKEFVETLQQMGISLSNVKDLDDLKHGEEIGFDYTKTKLPIHLIRELEIIDNLLTNVKINLSTSYDRVYLISDHGASRLAVINEQENKWEMVENGVHSGRCCPISELDEQPEFATQENGFWCLANYDRFKGGRKANVEVHGGASIEEVAVPIIEITKTHNRIDYNLPSDYQIIYVSFKKKAVIKLYVGIESNSIKALVNGRFYSANLTNDKYYYEFIMPEIKKTGRYTLDLYEGDNIIAQDILFDVKKEGATERKFF